MCRSAEGGAELSLIQIKMLGVVWKEWSVATKPESRQKHLKSDTNRVYHPRIFPDSIFIYKPVNDLRFFRVVTQDEI